MTVMYVLLKKLKAGDILTTPVRRKKFKVGSISPSCVTLIFGTKWRTPIPAECWNGITNFLKGKDWVEIGAIHGTSKSGTLEDYINNSKPVRRSTGNYVASILEYTGIVEIDRNLPSKVRLII